MNDNQGGGGQDIKLIHGDCFEVMQGMDSNSVDSIITDPPYGLRFCGQKWDYSIPTIELWQEVLRVLKPGGTALIFSGTRLYHRMACNVEDAGFEIYDKIAWCYGNGMTKSYNISKGMDKYHGVEREVVGVNPNHRENQNNLMAEMNQFTGDGMITAPATDDAKLWDGWGTSLAPAYEDIILARKPIEKNYVNNALKWGVAGLNIDGARTPIDENSKHKIGIKVFSKNQKLSVFGSNDGKNVALPLDEKGRFPKNMILDDVAGALIDEQSGQSVSSDSIRRNKMENSYGGGYGACEGGGFADEGGASRYFKNIPLDSRLLYIAKASGTEKNRGCERLEAKESGKGVQNSTNRPDGSERKNVKKQNTHTTIKPLLLMEFLCTLTKTPTGGVVLDPFMGSGTTGVACVNTERGFIGIEMNADYIEIAKARIKQAELDYQPQLF